MKGFSIKSPTINLVDLAGRPRLLYLLANALSNSFHEIFLDKITNGCLGLI